MARPKPKNAPKNAWQLPLHSEHFSIICFILASVMGIIFAIWGVVIVGEFARGRIPDLQDILITPFGAAGILLNGFSGFALRLLIGGLPMIAITMLSIQFARKNDLVNWWFAAICGIPVAGIYWLTTMAIVMFGEGGQMPNDLSIAASAIMSGGLFGGLTYYLCGKFFGFWLGQVESQVETDA